MTVSGLVWCLNILEKIAGWPLTKFGAGFLLPSTNQPRMLDLLHATQRKIFLERIPLRPNQGEHDLHEVTYDRAHFLPLKH